MKPVSEPLFKQYPGQYRAQPTYLLLDPVKRELSAHTSGEVGNGVPMAVWNGVVRRYWLPSPYLTQEAVEWLMGQIIREAEQVCDGFEVVWNGSNHVGRLTEEAQEAELEIEAFLRDYQPDEGDLIDLVEEL